MLSIQTKDKLTTKAPQNEQCPGYSNDITFKLVWISFRFRNWNSNNNNNVRGAAAQIVDKVIN